MEAGSTQETFKGYVIFGTNGGGYGKIESGKINWSCDRSVEDASIFPTMDAVAEALVIAGQKVGDGYYAYGPLTIRKVVAKTFTTTTTKTEAVAV